MSISMQVPPITEKEFEDFIQANQLKDAPLNYALFWKYYELLFQWNAKFNLIASGELSKFLYRHLSDALALLEVIKGRKVLDLGAGAGLPGALLSIARNDISVACVDSVLNKVCFIRHVASELSLTNLQALHTRLEVMEPSFIRKYEAIVTRAMFPPHKMVATSADLMQRFGILQSIMIVGDDALNESYDVNDCLLLEKKSLHFAERKVSVLHLVQK